MHRTRHLPIMGHYRVNGTSIRVFFRDEEAALAQLIDAASEQGIPVTIFDRESLRTIYTPEQVRAEALRRTRP